VGAGRAANDRKPAVGEAMRVVRFRVRKAVARGTRAFTLAEVVISMAMAALTVSGVISCYLMAVQRSEWTAASTAAHQLAMDRMAQLRALRWEVSWEGDATRTNELVAGSFVDPGEALDLPQTGTEPLLATNYVTVTRLNDPPLLLLRVDCVWSLLSLGPFTNTLVSYRASDQ
jgi:type II secretory pathway pseudopilin PulG